MAFSTRTSPQAAGPTGTSDRRGVGALGVIDTALSLATRREFFTAEEARQLLECVRNKVHDGAALQEELAVKIADAEASFADAALVDRSRLVDALLDLRLILAP